jgi:hypothetical protein
MKACRRPARSAASRTRRPRLPRPRSPRVRPWRGRERTPYPSCEASNPPGSAGD